MRSAHTVAQVREAEAALMATLPEGTLMQRAAAGLAAASADFLGSVYGARVGLLDDLAQAITDQSLGSDDDVFWSECATWWKRKPRVRFNSYATTIQACQKSTATLNNLFRPC